MTSTREIDGWIARYAQAWNSNHPDEIGQLFTKSALYLTGPFDRPWKGRDAIVEGWVARQDAPGRCAEFTEWWVSKR